MCLLFLSRLGTNPKGVSIGSWLGARGGRPDLTYSLINDCRFFLSSWVKGRARNILRTALRDRGFPSCDEFTLQISIPAWKSMMRSWFQLVSWPLGSLTWLSDYVVGLVSLSMHPHRHCFCCRMFPRSNNVLQEKRLALSKGRPQKT